MFAIGQKVICIKKHSQGILKVGATYTIKDTSNCICGCPNVSIGYRTSFGRMRCAILKVSYNSDIWWFRANLFALIEHLSKTYIEEFININEMEIL